MSPWIVLLALAVVAPAARQGASPATDNPGAIVARAVASQQAGRLEEAAEDYERFLALVPGSWQARSNLGAVYVQLGRTEDAIGQYAKALELSPGQVAVRYNLALALYKASRLRDAVSELERIRTAQPDHPTAPLLLADCHLRLGEWKEVIAILDPLLEKDPDNQAILYMIGTALMRDRQYERGQRVLDRILRRGDSAEAHLLLALASREAQDDLSSREELEKALALDPKLPSANGLLGSVLMTMGEGAAAIAAFRRELEIEPNDFESHLLLGALLRQDFDNDGAMSHLQRALDLRPEDPGALYQIALVHIARGELEPARRILEGLVVTAPEWLEAHVSLTTVYYRLGRRADGDRQQEIVRELRAAEQQKRDAEKARKEAASP